MAVTDTYPWLEKPQEFLKKMSSKLPNAVLIHGPRGCGTFELGVAFAHSLLCSSPVDSEACGQCPECKLTEAGNHPDLLMVLSEVEARNHPEVLPEQVEDSTRRRRKAAEDKADTAKAADRRALSRNISIEQVRDATEFISTTAKRGGKRIVLIYPADMMQAAQSSALLKTLEEPPPNSIIILVSDNLDLMLPTIRSRCQLVHVAPPTKEQGIEFLKSRAVKNPEDVLAKFGGLPLLYFESDEKLSLAEDKQKALLTFLAKGANATSSDVVYLTAKEFTTIPLIVLLQRWTNDLILGSMGLAPRYFINMKDKTVRIGKRAQAKKLYAYLDELATARRTTFIALNTKMIAQELLLDYIQACS